MPATKAWQVGDRAFAVSVSGRRVGIVQIVKLNVDRDSSYGPICYVIWCIKHPAVGKNDERWPERLLQMPVAG